MPAGYQRGVTLEANLVYFIQLLRRLGLRISTAETLTALEALKEIPLDREGMVRAALQAALVKDDARVALFHQAWAHFFHPDGEQEAEPGPQLSPAGNSLPETPEPEQDLLFRGRPLELPASAREIYRQLTPEIRERLQQFVRASEAGAPDDERFRPLLASLVSGHLNYWGRQLAEEQPLVDPWEGTEMDASLAQIVAAADQDTGLLWADLKELTRADPELVIRVIRRLVRRLAGVLARRYHPTRKKRVISWRPSIRRNLQYGGLPLRLIYRARRVKKPRLLLLADVSGSMARYSAFVMEFIYGLGQVVGGVEAFVFAEDFQRVTPLLDKKLGPVELQDRLMSATPTWGAGTRLDLALAGILKDYPALFQKNTVIVIISDTKTLQVPAAAASLKAWRRRVKDILWLNTLRREEWGRWQSVAALRPYCRMFSCRSLGQLEIILREYL
ncbi:protein containing von Willebrand factor type A (vWA) domain [Moorella thermoacetica Y72]|uniref:Protein containing von Willebrand factor type A (VWA) domain n=1 Tax=Moorella thermoacetica Y72 TaxID=1325331 RepID=A0A0S6UGK8_NEOTH|nr:VWA domain-containing protein [Moorella thermoacetica]GAF26544.1 protein containing von Willebrand factor type A (vWA) domain [Moorella thermoacetica Y72]